MTESTTKAPGEPAGRPRLDTAFPSIRLLGLCVFVVVLGLVFAGWNMVHLDQQWADLARQKAVLEKEKADLAEYTAELPTLERRHADLTSLTAALEKNRQILDGEVAQLEQQRQEARKILDETLSANYLAQNAQREAQRELTQIIEEINTGRPMLIAIEARLAVLKVKELSLREALAGEETRKAQLAADLKGLERERDHARELLERMLNDRKTLADFSDAVKASARGLDQAAKDADAAAKKFTTVTSDLGGSTLNLKTEAAAIADKVQPLEAQIAQLTARNKALAGAAEQDEKIRRELKSQVETLTAAVSSLNQSGKEMDAQIRKWSQRSDQTLADVGRVERALTPLPKNLETALKSLSAGADRLAAQVKALEGQTTAMRNLAGMVGPLQNQARDFSKATKTLQDEASQTQKSGETLLRRLDELRQSVEAAQELVKGVSARLREPSPKASAADQPGGESAEPAVSAAAPK